MNTCRFCKTSGEPLIKYGVRHYAHARCMLTVWGADTWDRLHLWQLENFPFRIAQRAGLGQSLADAIAARQNENAKTGGLDRLPVRAS